MEHLVVLLGFLFSAVLGAVAALPVYAMGLVVSMVVIWPLTLGVSALAASLVAWLFGNLARRDGPGPRLPAVVGVTIAAAAAVVAFSAASLLLPVGAQPLWPAIYNIAGASVLLALVATYSARRFVGRRG